MPVVLPTPAEYAAMPWHRRRTLIREAAALVRAYRIADPAALVKPPRPWHEEVIEQARDLHAVLGPDPDADAHWAQLAVEVAS